MSKYISQNEVNEFIDYVARCGVPRAALSYRLQLHFGIGPKRAEKYIEYWDNSYEFRHVGNNLVEVWEGKPDDRKLIFRINKALIPKLIETLKQAV